MLRSLRDRDITRCALTLAYGLYRAPHERFLAGQGEAMRREKSMHRPSAEPRRIHANEKAGRRTTDEKDIQHYLLSNCDEAPEV